MGAVLRLQVLLRVPVAVEKNDCVGGGEVDALPACARRDEADADVVVGVERADGFFAIRGRDAAVDAAYGPGVQDLGPVLEDVELGLELGKDKDLVAAG